MPPEVFHLGFVLDTISMNLAELIDCGRIIELFEKPTYEEGTLYVTSQHTVDCQSDDHRERAVVDARVVDVDIP